MDGNCKAGLNSSVNVNVVDRVVFRFHKVIVYHVVKLLRSKDWAQLNFRQRMLAEFLIWSIPFAFCCVTCSTNSIFTQRTRHVFRYPGRRWTPSSSCWKMPSGLVPFFHKTLLTSNRTQRNSFNEFRLKMRQKRRVPFKNCIVLDARTGSGMAKFFNLVKWLVFSTTLAAAERPFMFFVMKCIGKSAELGGALHFLLMMESQKSALYSFW